MVSAGPNDDSDVAQADSDSAVRTLGEFQCDNKGSRSLGERCDHFSAATGSTRVARNAGTRQAPNATSARHAMTLARISGSLSQRSILRAVKLAGQR
jgi:hypothetical protein